MKTYTPRPILDIAAAFGGALLIFFCLPAHLKAQFTRIVDEAQVVDIEGRQLKYPFIGGMKSPRPELVDIDGDGDLDLFLQLNARRLEFFERVGDDWQWRTSNWMDINIGNWYNFVDFDDDGDIDLVCAGEDRGFRLYRNVGSPQQAVLELATDQLLDTDQLLISPGGLQSVPAWADIDCDGDEDLFMGDVDGTITFYEHIGLDTELLPRYDLVTNRFEQLFIITAGTQKSDDKDEIAGGGKHGENVLTFVDIDGDNDQDFIWGDFFAGGLLLFENTGNCDDPEFTNGDVRFPQNNPLNTEAFNIPRFGDVDNDGDQDMIVGILDGVFGSADAGPGLLYYLENIGSAQAPEFVERTAQLIRTLDFGEAAAPAFADLNGDGLPEIIVGNETIPGTIERGTLTYMEQSEGVLRVINNDYFGIDVGNNLKPTFADLDGDDDLDMVVGHWDGKLTHFVNIGSPAQPFFEESDLLAGIDLGTYAAPFAVDVDGDMDNDLVVGALNGALALLRNSGDATMPQFELVDEQYLGLDIGTSSQPAFGDIDNDNDLDLLIGTGSDGVLVYRNNGGGFEDLVLDNTYQFEIHSLSAPAIGDIDGDGDQDVMVGTSNGGMILYRNDVVVGVAENESAANQTSEFDIQVRPQPARLEQLRLEIVNRGTARGDLSLQLSDLTGRLLWRRDITLPTGSLLFNLAELSMSSGISIAGPLFLRLVAGDGQFLAQTSTIVLP